jgi:hypothetical protein
LDPHAKKIVEHLDGLERIDRIHVQRSIWGRYTATLAERGEPAIVVDFAPSDPIWVVSVVGRIGLLSTPAVGSWAIIVVDLDTHREITREVGTGTVPHYFNNI